MELDEALIQIARTDPNALNWPVLARDFKLSESFIDEFFEEFFKNKALACLRALATQQKLSEDFIRKHADRMHWSALTFSTNITERLAAEFPHKIQWPTVHENQLFSEEFRLEMRMKGYE